MQLIFATHNAHKLQEIKMLLPKSIKLLSLTDLNFTEDIPETADTLKGNAFLKAKLIYDKFKVDCFADDSGLEVDALNGAPGVYSARYAGEQQDAEKNMEKLLKELGTQQNRKAQFKTLIALILKGETHYFEGIIAGTITFEKHGTSGFGYDPIFKPTGSDRTFAQMSAEEKNSISHRALAVNKLVDFLKQNTP